MTAEAEGSSELVVLATAGYDHAIKFWQAHSGICLRTVQHPDSVSFAFVKSSSLQTTQNVTLARCLSKEKKPDDLKNLSVRTT